ncbi:MAG: hypothetical protein GWN07_25280, partial [Actinobacteria bacterium]|nr:hypothetical protein [Actinomycetota bacterium]
GGDAEAEEPSVDGSYEVVLDPADFDPSYRTSLATIDFSEDGSLMLYSVRRGGADEISVRVRDLERGRDLPDSLPNALYGGVGFEDGGEAFVYTHRSRFE